MKLDPSPTESPSGQKTMRKLLTLKSGLTGLESDLTGRREEPSSKDLGYNNQIRQVEIS